MSTYKTVKAIDDFVRGCKTDLVWDKLTEVYLLCAATFPGILCKLKNAGTATLTNNNFVTGDYLAAGSGAGLVGNISTKYLRTSFNSMAANGNSLSVYLTAPGTGSATQEYLGYDNNADGVFIGQINSGTQEAYQSGVSTASYVGTTVARRNGMLLGTDRSATDREFYRNGTTTSQSAVSGTPTSSGEIWMFQRALGLVGSDARMTFAHVGTGLTDTDALNLSTRVNALMTALGTNVY